MGPRGLGPKTIKLLKSLETMKTIFQHGQNAHRDSAKAALNDSSRSLIWNFVEQIVFLKICEKVSKVTKLDQFWVHLVGPKKLWKIVKIMEKSVRAVCLTTRLRRVIGCLQTR